MVNIGNDWDNLLQGEFEKTYYRELRTFLANEYRTKIIYPSMYNIFEALKLTAYKDVRAVILGQDPYHGEGQAHGLAFSVQKGIAIPPSLLNIYKELQTDCGCSIPNNGYLEKWARQGVLLLNASLTVRAGMANSHQNAGWQIFTDKIIELLNERDKKIVFLLWGSNARAKKTLITNPIHSVLEAPHPSPLSAHRGFFGCHHFSETNKILKADNQKEIDWQIENI